MKKMFYFSKIYY